MRIMPKIALGMWDVLGKSYSKYESHPWMFVRPSILEAEWAAEEEKDTKKKKKQKKKNSDETIKTSRPTDGMPNYQHYVRRP